MRNEKMASSHDSGTSNSPRVCFISGTSGNVIGASSSSSTSQLATIDTLFPSAVIRNVSHSVSSAANFEQDLTTIRSASGKTGVSPQDRLKIVRKLLNASVLSKKPFRSSLYSDRVRSCFEQLFERSTDKPVSYVACKHCGKLMSFAQKMASGQLIVHLSRCPKYSSELSRSSPVPEENTERSSVIPERARSYVWPQIVSDSFKPPAAVVSSQSQRTEWVKMFQNEERVIFGRPRMTRYTTGLHYGTTCDFVELNRSGVPRLSSGRMIIPETEYRQVLANGKIKTAQAFQLLFAVDFKKYDESSYTASVVQSSSGL